MNKDTLANIIIVAFVFILGIGLGASEHTKNCSVTITDMRGVQHVIKGIADET